MIGIFSSLKSLIALNKVTIDNGVFVLHYKVTVLILLVCTMLISCKQHFGEPITCLADNNDVKFGRAIDAYCWVHATYTVNELIDGKVGSKVLRPGVGPHTKLTSKKIHKYYQWVGFFLLFQAWFFYCPRFLWKIWEGGRIKILSMNLETQLNYREKDLITRRKAIAHYILRNFHRQNYYAIRYLFCELLNFVNVVIQIVLTDRFLGYEFSTYGRDVINFIYEGMNERADPMDKIFPKLSKCQFNQFGPSGNIIPYDVLCVLPLNILNEKIFVFLWFWFIIVASASFIGIVYRVSTVIFSAVRKYRLETKASLCEEIELRIISRYCHFGDWLILHQLSKNMDALIYADLLKDIAYKLKKHGMNAIGNNKSSFSSKSNSSSRQEINGNIRISEPLYDIVHNDHIIEM